MMMRCVIFDIDGTLSDPTHRLHHVTGDNRDWDAFFAAVGDDPVHEPIVDLLRIITNANEGVILCSGRPEAYRITTKNWLRNVCIFYYLNLYMRADGDHRADHIVKAGMLARMREDGYEPWLVIDDRPSVVEMWREAGLTCLQCRDWNERAPTIKPGLLTLMVGPTGAGKTEWLRSIETTMFSIQPRHVVSSDAIRADLCGDYRDQTRNDEVFAALHAVVKARVASGLPTVVDATNLRNRDRKAIVELVPGAPVRYLVLNRPMEDKYRDAGWRADLGFDLIAKHEATFNSNLKAILAGDGLPNVTVVDLRQ